MQRIHACCRGCALGPGLPPSLHIIFSSTSLKFVVFLLFTATVPSLAAELWYGDAACKGTSAPHSRVAIVPGRPRHTWGVDELSDVHQGETSPKVQLKSPLCQYLLDNHSAIDAQPWSCSTGKCTCHPASLASSARWGLSPILRGPIAARLQWCHPSPVSLESLIRYHRFGAVMGAAS